MLMGPYKDCYSRVYIFSPSCAKGVDSAWDAWRKHVKNYMKVPDDEQTMWDTWEPEIIEKLIAKHRSVNQYLKSKKQKTGYTILFVIDDFADAGDKVMHSSTNVLTSLFVRGRHIGAACWLLSQKLRVISNTCRTNFWWMMIWRLRNSRELNSILEELDTLHDRKILMHMYMLATQEKHSFWYVNLLNEKEQMFYKNFEHQIVVS